MMGYRKASAEGFSHPKGFAESASRDGHADAATRKDKYCVIHFFHPDFQRCQIMDRRLEVS